MAKTASGVIAGRTFLYNCVTPITTPMKTLSIAEHWDTGAQITASSDPQEEYTIWLNHVDNGEGVWNGHEFTLEDFEIYIASLSK